MKTEFLQNFKVGDQALPKEVIDAILAENGRDIENAKKPFADYDAIKDQLKTAQDGLKAFDGVDVAGLQEQVTKLKADMKAQAEGFAFDNALNAAILGRKGRSVKAVRALLDLDALKGSKDRTTDITKALDDVAKANPWAFGDTQPAGASVGGLNSSVEHNATNSGGEKSLSDTILSAMGL